MLAQYFSTHRSHRAPIPACPRWPPGRPPGVLRSTEMGDQRWGGPSWRCSRGFAVGSQAGQPGHVHVHRHQPSSSAWLMGRWSIRSSCPRRTGEPKPIGDTGISRPDSTAARPPPDPSGRTPPAVPKLGAQRPVQQLGGRRQRVSFRSPSTISSGRPEIRSRDVPHRRGGHPPAVSVRGGRSSAPTARPITPIGQLNGRDADALQDVPGHQIPTPGTKISPAPTERGFFHDRDNLAPDEPHQALSEPPLVSAVMNSPGRGGCPSRNSPPWFVTLFSMGTVSRVRSTVPPRQVNPRQDSATLGSAARQSRLEVARNPPGWPTDGRSGGLSTRCVSPYRTEKARYPRRSTRYKTATSTSLAARGSLNGTSAKCRSSMLALVQGWTGRRFSGRTVGQVAGGGEFRTVRVDSQLGRLEPRGTRGHW